MDTICWLHILYMIVQGRLHSSEHRQLVVIYKVDQFVERFLLSSLVLLLYKSYSFVQLLELKFITYNVITKLLNKFGLIVEHSKTEVFYFNRLHSFFDLSSLNLLPIRGSILTSKSLQKYLGFIFDRKLSFHQHISYYSNRAISMVKYMKILGNSSCSIISIQKYLLYRYYIFPIALYSFQLQFYKHTPLSYLLKILGKMQRRAAI